MPDRQDEPFLFPDDGDPEEISPEFIIGDATQVGSPNAARAKAAAPSAKPEPKAEPTPATARKQAPRPRAASPKRPEPAAAPAPSAAHPPASAPAPAAAHAPAPHVPPERRVGFPLLPAFLFLAVGFGAGFFAGRLWERPGTAPPAAPVASKAPEEPAPPPAPADEPRRATKAVKGTKTARTARAPGSAGAASAAPEGKGRLDLTAPPDAEAWLDGRRIGKGSLRVDVTPGKHKIEVRLGKARVGERFEVGPNETWTYEVTPR